MLLDSRAPRLEQESSNVGTFEHCLRQEVRTSGIQLGRYTWEVLAAFWLLIEPPNIFHQNSSTALLVVQSIRDQLLQGRAVFHLGLATLTVLQEQAFPTL